ncbi:MAG: hypothetical protein P4M11_00940 [Candidatus Pacebacteria bacterium]|nr:hypothetical protein [Candidatus Paceibacterota bacterium]
MFQQWYPAPRSIVLDSLARYFETGYSDDWQLYKKKMRDYLRRKEEHRRRKRPQRVHHDKLLKCGICGQEVIAQKMMVSIVSE